MYLSRLTLNPRSRQVQTALAQPHRMHSTILAAFPDDVVGKPRGARGAAGVLYRVDEHPHSHQLDLLVQSQIKPAWSELELEQYLLPDIGWFGDRQNPAVKEVDLRFQAGQRLAFRLLANPTKRLGVPYPQGPGKRVGLYKLEEQEGWIARKGKNHGFTVLHHLPTNQQQTQDYKKNLKFFSVQFNGILQVTDPDKFQAAIHSGIGSGKAFGFGLLSVAPTR